MKSRSRAAVKSRRCSCPDSWHALPVQLCCPVHAVVRGHQAPSHWPPDEEDGEPRLSVRALGA